VRINLADVSDASERDRFESEAEEIVARASQTIRQVIPSIWQRQTNLA
jgi:hypothetical protein